MMGRFFQYGVAAIAAFLPASLLAQEGDAYAVQAAGNQFYSGSSGTALAELDYHLPLATAAPAEPIAIAPAPEGIAGADPVAMEPVAPARAATPVLVRGRSLPRWQEIRRYEIAYQSLNLIDAAQTIAALRSGKAQEANPLLGDNPSTITIIGYKAAWGGVHYMVTRWLMREHPEYARLYQFASIAVQGGTVTWNMTRVF